MNGPGRVENQIRLIFCSSVELLFFLRLSARASFIGIYFVTLFSFLISVFISVSAVIKLPQLLCCVRLDLKEATESEVLAKFLINIVTGDRRLPL